MKSYIPRMHVFQLETELNPGRAIYLAGPRQAGKSTLTRKWIENYQNSRYVTLDDLNQLAAAQNDPVAFIKSFQGVTVIDEIQRVPGLFLPIKQRIDEQRLSQPGTPQASFILTGSANVMALPGLSNAMVGRMHMMTLYPLSVCEVLSKNDYPSPQIQHLLAKDFLSPRKSILYDLQALIRQATYPELGQLGETAAGRWLDDYLMTLFSREVQDIMEIEKLSAMPHMLRVMAQRAGGLVNDADCARDAGLSLTTYRRYRTVLEQVFLLQTIPAWFRQTGRRLMKSRKLYFLDTRLMAHLLGPDTLSPGNHYWGRLVENFVYTEILKQASVLPTDISRGIYHFRSQAGHEVDMVIEQQDRSIVGIEVKAGSTISLSDFGGLKILQEMAGHHFCRGIILYGGNEVVAFGPDLWALPITALWHF